MNLAQLFGAGAQATASAYEPKLSPAANAMVGAVAPVAAPAAPTGYQKPKGLRNTIGTIADILAVLGGRQPGYSSALRQNKLDFDAEQKLVREETTRRTFADFLPNMNDPAAAAAAARANPELFISAKDKLTPKPVQTGSLPTAIQIAEYLADPTKSPEAKQRVLQLSQGRPIATAEGYQMPEDAIGVYPYRAPPAPPTPSYSPQVLANGNIGSFDQRTGRVVDTGVPAGVKPTATGGRTNKPGVPPEEALALIGRAETLLPKATGGGLRGGVNSALGFVGVSSDQTKADASLNVLAARLAATVPRFEGPQSDKDTAAYSKAVGDVGNRALPAPDRLAALNEAKTIAQRYAGRAAAAPAAPGQRAAIAKGATATGPGGKKIQWNGTAWVPLN